MQIIARRLAALAVLGIALAAPGLAQERFGFSLGEAVNTEPPLALRTIDDERLFQESQFGQRVAAEIAAASRALEAENDALLENLTAREAELTELRAEMSLEEFRAAANEFDVQAEAVRRSQSEKRQRLVQFEESERRRFFAGSGPVLQEVLEQVGGDILIDARAVIIARPGVDMTDAAIVAMDAALGDGGPPPFPLSMP